QTVAAGRGQGAVRDSYRRVGREGDLGPDCHGFGLRQRHLAAGGLASHHEIQCMGIAVRDVGSPASQPLAPGAIIDMVDLTELDVDPPLADTGAAHAGEVGLAADLKREATIHDVIPAVPLSQAGGVHGANEITKALGYRDEDLLSADAVQL